MTMVRRYLFSLVLAISFLTCFAEEFNFVHHRILDDDYHMSWMLGDDDITVNVTVRTTGWIGWGISPNGAMKGADMVIGWIDSNGVKHLTDRHGIGNQMPVMDDEQNYDLVKMFEENGFTTIIFRRMINLTCYEEDNEIVGDTMRVLYAWNDEDPVENMYFAQHTKRGAKSLYLLDYSERAKQPYPTGFKSHDFLMNNTVVPADDTTYMCKTFKFIPNDTGKLHLIAVEVIITPGNEKYVHHMLLYQCKNIVDKDIGLVDICDNANMPDSDCGRETVIHAWAVGGTTYFYPKEVGLPLNVPGAPKYLFLEVHYDNPEERNDIVDSSGLRFIYTDKVRSFDAGILQVGINPAYGAFGILVPQKQKNFTTFTYCRSQCINITSKKHYLFSAALHSHKAGRRIAVRMIRDSDNVEVMRIAEDKYYDFNYQELKHFKEPIEIPPGHSIDIECTYNSEDREVPVTGGESTTQEMCLVYLYIYPYLDLKTCYSLPGSVEFLFKKLNVTLLHRVFISSSYVTGGRDVKTMRVDKVISERTFWTENLHKPLVKEFERAGKEENYTEECKYAQHTVENLVAVKPRTHLKDEEAKCDNKNKGGIKRVSKLMLFIVVLCTWLMFR